MKKLFYFIVQIIALLAFQNSYAWQEGIDYDQLLNCSELPLNGAKIVLVRVKPADGSYGLPTLIGKKEDLVVWTLKFPKTDEVNVAKFEASCSGQTIKLWYQSPDQNTALVQEYTWNGNSIIKIREFHEVTEVIPNN